MTSFKKLAMAIAIAASVFTLGSAAHAEVPKNLRPALNDAINSTVNIRGRGPVEQNGTYKSWTGSGYIVAIQGNDAIIATNCHVACHAAFLWVSSHDGRMLDDARATLITGDLRQDIAFIKVPAKPGMKVLPLYAGKVEVGERAVAIGGPLGITFTVTEGIISASNRTDLNYPTPDGVHQTDAAINPGNSGGPLLVLRDDHFVVAGMDTFIITDTGNNVGLGFAIPATDVARYLDAVLHGQTPRTPTMGAGFEKMTPVTANVLGLPAYYLRQNIYGLAVTSVAKGSAAEAAGLQPLDVVLEANHHFVREIADLRDVLVNSTAEDGVTLRIFHNGGVKELLVFPTNTWGQMRQVSDEDFNLRPGTTPTTPEAYPADNIFGMDMVNPGSSDYLSALAPFAGTQGFSMINAPLVTRIYNMGPAHEAGIMKGMFIRAVMVRGLPMTQVRSTDDIHSYMESAKNMGLPTDEVVFAVAVIRINPRTHQVQVGEGFIAIHPHPFKAAE